VSSSVRILASTGPMFARPLDWACGVIAEAGYDGVELMITQDPTTQDSERVDEVTRTEGAPAEVVHGPFLLLTRRVLGTDLVTKARRSLQVASDLGADTMIVHPPFRWQRQFHEWLLDEGDAEATELGTRIGVENLYPVQVRGRPMRFHRYTEPEHLSPFPHVVLDTSHFAVAEVDINAAWDRLRHQAVHLHVSDNRGQGRDSHAPLGHGKLPLGAFLHTVGADEQTPTSITLELDCRRYLDDRAALVGYLRQELTKCRDLLGGAPVEEVLGRPDRVEVAPGAHEDDADQPTVG
jgi:sugar phosphate isomerase/epimerase